VASPAAAGCDRRGSARVDSAVSRHSHELGRARYGPGTQLTDMPALADKSVRPEPQPFAFANVQQLAQKRATHDYRPMPDALPAALANLSYDQYRDIRFRPESALCTAQSLFEVQFFHRGFHVSSASNIFEVSSAGTSPGRLQPSVLQLRASAQGAEGCGESRLRGLRVHYPLQSPAYKDELIVFLGALISVCSAAISITAPRRALWRSIPQHPAGRNFPHSPISGWCGRKPPIAVLTIYALLDGKSVAARINSGFDPAPHSGRSALPALPAPRPSASSAWPHSRPCFSTARRARATL